MTRIILSLALAAVLASCGGGGGGGDTPTPPPVNNLTLTVKVNNANVVPGTGNTVPIASGDTISVAASKNVTWSTATNGTLVVLGNNAASAQAWTGRLSKLATSAGTLMLTATSGAETVTLHVGIPAGDPRNGNYKLFSTDANEYALNIDFDTRQYTVRSAAGAVVINSNFTGPVDGTYTFNVTDFLPVPGGKSRFRVGFDVIVGSHPVGGTQTRPFIASNNFVTSAADLPLTNMWMFASDNAPADTPPINSRIQAIRLVANQITYCSVAVGPLTTVANCLPANLATHALTFNADGSVTWDDNGIPVNLYVVRLANELVLVRAQSYPTGTGNKRFQIALDDAKAMDNIVYEGGVSNGSWGTTTVAASFSRVAVTPADVPDNVSGTLVILPAVQPLRTVITTTDGVGYFVQTTAMIGADIAARGSQKAGQISFGLRR